jgi:hypothetical protein
MEGAQIALIGASGDVGRAMPTEVIHERVLTPAARMLLVGRSDGAGTARLLGLVNDLTDAYGGGRSNLEVVLERKQSGGYARQPRHRSTSRLMKKGSYGVTVGPRSS